MSNPADPKKPNPDQPDPNAPAEPQTAHEGTGSMFEFALPDDVDAFGKLPPIPSPDAHPCGKNFDAPLAPPAPPASNPFGFGTGSHGSFGDFGFELPPPPAPAPTDPLGLTSAEDAFELPELSTGAGDSAALLESPAEPVLTPPLALESADLPGVADLEQPIAEPFELPDLPVAPEHVALAEIDLDDATLEAVPVAADAPAEFTEPIALAEVEELPAVEAELDRAELPDAGGSSVALGARPPKTTDPSSFSLGSLELPNDVPAPAPSSFSLAKPASSGSVPDVGTLRPPVTASDSTPDLPGRAAPGSTGSTPELPTGHRGGSSFEFQLPDSVNTYSDLPPIPEPDELGSKGDFGVLPPRPPAAPRDASFDFINVTGERSFAEIDLSGKAIDPPAPAAPPATDSKVGLGNLEPVELVTPASGWLDAALPAPVPTPVDVPEADVFDAPVAAELGTSDIFAGAPVMPAQPVETSDVLAATSGAPLAEPVRPSDPARPSDVALTFNEPLGGSTVHDGDLSDLPLADDDVAGFELEPRGDEESIHDMPAVDAEQPFDSGPLANMPDLPAFADAPEYGAPPAFTPDASSILADLSTPDLELDDASSVRVEAPGMDRTLGSGEHDVFELTVPEEPIPAGLFDDADDGAEPTNWEQQSGSDLLTGRTTAPDAGMVEPVDTDLFSDQPSLSSSPSSIFSGAKRPSGSGDSADADLTPPSDTTEDFAEAAEFTDSPMDATVSAPPLGTGARPVVPNIDSRDFDLPATAPDELEEVGQIDFDVAAPTGAEYTQAAPPGASLSSIIRDELGGYSDDSEEMSTRGTQVREPDPSDETRQPEVSLDYLSESTEGSALGLPLQKPAAKGKGKDKSKKARPTAAEDAKTRPTKAAPLLAEPGTETEEKALPGKKGSGLLIGALLGALAAGGAWAGVYFGDVIPNAKPGSGPSAPSAQNGTKPPAPPVVTPVALDPQAAFAAGDSAKAIEHYKTTPPTTLTEKTDAGFVRVFAKAHALAPGATAATDDADLVAARKDLEDVIAKPDAVAEPGGVKRGVKASVALGASYELSGDLKAARKVYAEALQRYPAYKSTFEAHIDRLDALEPPAPAGTSRRITPAEAEFLLATVLLLQDAPKTEEVEPGVYFWKAVKAANSGNYKDALALIDQAKAAHLKLAPAFSGRGINPLSDPREQVFAKSCDELKAYWKLRGAVSGNPDMIAAIKKDGGDLAKAIDTFSKSADAVVKAEKETVAARETVKKLEGEVAKLDKSLKASDKEKIEAEKKLETATTDLKTAEKKLETATTDLKTAEKDVEAKQTTLVSLVEVLKPATPIPDKWGPADLLSATKAVVARATGPDLKALVPNAMTAIGGGGLAAGQLIEIAERLNKAETGAKDAIAKLMVETKKLRDEHAAEVKKLTDDRTAEVKKLTDGYTADIKKLNDAHAVAVTKLKDGSAEELKKLTDKYATDSKKLTDDYAAAVTKLKDDHAVALKAEQEKTETEKKRALAKELEFQKQLANAVTQSQVMDLWLPLLTDLRRVSDTGPALTAAQKALAASAPDSEDAAKARTVSGLAYLIRGDLDNAKEMFQSARRSPAYKTAAGKPWAVAADTGLEAVTDPVAPFRQPVVAVPVNFRSAAASLDAGITGYKSGRYDVAVKALLDATKNNPADPVAWYFLGAARWAQGNEDQAKKDFEQGAEREKVSTVSNRVTSEALSPIQGATRDAIDRVRP